MKYIQYIPPYGEKEVRIIPLSSDLENWSAQMQDAGWQFDIERLMTGEYSLTCSNSDAPLVMETFSTAVPLTEMFTILVQSAHAAWEKIGKISACEWDYETDEEGVELED